MVTKVFATSPEPEVLLLHVLISVKPQSVLEMASTPRELWEMDGRLDLPSDLYDHVLLIDV